VPNGWPVATALYPIPAIVVALVVLAMRVHDRNAWLRGPHIRRLGTGPLETGRIVEPSGVASFLVSYACCSQG